MNQTPTRIRFPARSGFYQVLTERVHAELGATGRSGTAGVRGALGVGFILALVGGAYASLLFWVETGWQVALASFALIQGLVLMGTSMMHEGVHGAVFEGRWRNRLLARSLELMGGNRSLWGFKHTVVHHTYTSIAGVDEDIDTGGFLRLHPAQPWQPRHRFQVFYFPVIYSLSALHWVISDFVTYARGRVGATRVPRFSRAEHLLFWLGKALWLSLFLVLPMMFHPPGLVLAIGVAIYLVFGMNIALLFQLAHIVDDVDPVQPAADGTMDQPWAVHQLQSTVTFGTSSRFWNWYTGGLSQQIEHHLFPCISHVHYPMIARVVKRTCAEFDIPYREHRTVRSVVASHIRHLAAMGRPPADPGSGPG